MVEPVRKKIDRTIEKKCIKCRKVLLHKYFGKHDTSADGLQSICQFCKAKANKSARGRNVKGRLRHHIATRCLTQLGEHAPEGLTKDLEKYLGYRLGDLVKHLREDLKEREGPDRSLNAALNEGYHVDHIRPLSSFKVLKHGPANAEPGLCVDWRTFKECWAITNLSAIPAEENLAKGATYDEPSMSEMASEAASEAMDEIKDVVDEAFNTGEPHGGKVP